MADEQEQADVQAAVAGAVNPMAEALAGLPDYDYFSYMPKDRLPDLNKQIEEREKKLFELQLAILALVDNPAADTGVMSHDDFATFIQQQREDAESNGRKFVATQACPCSACEISRLRRMSEAQIFALNKMRALSATLIGGK